MPAPSPRHPQDAAAGRVAGRCPLLCGPLGGVVWPASSAPGAPPSAGWPPCGAGAPWQLAGRSSGP
eukprot:1760127-Pyramimonas_sp.AAC.1